MDVAKENDGKYQCNEEITEEIDEIKIDSESVKHDASKYGDEVKPESNNSSDNHKLILEIFLHIKREFHFEIKETRESIAKRINSVEITNQGPTSKKEINDQIKPELLISPKELTAKCSSENTAKCSGTVKKSLRLRRTKNKMEEEDKRCNEYNYSAEGVFGCYFGRTRHS